MNYARFMHSPLTPCHVHGCASIGEPGELPQDAIRHEAALARPLRNPHDGSTNWYHGTSFNPAYDEDDEYAHEGGTVRPPSETGHGNDDMDGRTNEHWNTDLGSHFTSLQRVAHGFAEHGDREHSRVLTAGLHMANPKHFDSEEQMADHAINWATRNGHRFLQGASAEDYDKFADGRYGYSADEGDEDHEHLGEHMDHLHDQVGGYEHEIDDIDHHGARAHVTDSTKERWLTVHPERESLTSGYVDHLRSQGHDGITYGNSIEGPKGHTCAIAFDDTPIHHRKWTWTDAEQERKHHSPQTEPQHVPGQTRMQFAPHPEGGVGLTAARTAVQAPPGEMSFERAEEITGGSKWPVKATLTAVHPEHGVMGTLSYYPPKRKGGRMLVDNLQVRPEHRRRGIGSALMDAMQARHPGSTIDHGERTDDGKAWWGGYTQGKDVTRGRTATTLYRGEGDPNRPSPYYPRSGPDANLAGGWWTDDPQKASNYAKSQPDGKVYSVDVEDHEFEPRGARGNYFITDPEVRARRQEHTALVLDDWMPTERLFAPTKGTVDPILFGTDRHMLPEVREEILAAIDEFFLDHGYGDPDGWARVYLAGSQASEWHGNRDFDILIGVNYDKLRKAHPQFNGMTVEQIDTQFNTQLRDDFNQPDWHPAFDPTQAWDRTGYVNPNSWNIADIKPYAAYNVTDDEWAVQPIHEPEGHRFEQSEIYYFEGVAAQARSALAMPEPLRTRRCSQIWEFVHSDRSRAFGPHGTGAFDRGNALEKYLDQATSPYSGVSLMQALANVRYGKEQKTAARGSSPVDSAFYDRQNALSRAVKPRRYTDQSEAAEAGKDMLRRAGHPRADDLILLEGNVGHSSAMHHDGVPAIMLNHDHMHEHVLAHEVAHLMVQHQRGVDETGEDSHGEDFERQFNSLLDEPSAQAWREGKEQKTAAAQPDPGLYPRRPLFRPGDKVMSDNYPGVVHHVEESEDAGGHPRIWVTEDGRDHAVGIHQSRVRLHPDASAESREHHARQVAKDEAGKPYVPQAERNIDENDRVTVHHLTGDPHFAPSVSHRPENNTTMGGDLSPRLFVGDPTTWAEGEYGYKRPYVAEMSVPRGAVHSGHGYSGEGEIHARNFDKVHVNRVIPYDAYDREKYGVHGRAESYHGTTFDTGEKITPEQQRNNDYGRRNFPAGYHWPGDTRDWSSEQHRQYVTRHNQYLQGEHGWDIGDDHEWGSQHEAVLRRYAKTAGLFGPSWYETAPDEKIDEHPAAEQIRGYMTHHTSPQGHVYRLTHDSSKYVTATYLGKGNNRIKKPQMVGSLTYFGGQANDQENISGRIHKVFVKPAHRRRGLASAMLDHARAMAKPGDEIEHSTALSEDGKAWSAKKASRTAGANGNLPEGLTFHHEPATVERYPDPGPDVQVGYPKGAPFTFSPHRITAHLPDGNGGTREVGHLELDGMPEFLQAKEGKEGLRPGADRVVSHVHVDDEHRRKGIANAMWEHAKSLGLNPMHSNVQFPDGVAWSQQVDPENSARTRRVRASIIPRGADYAAFLRHTGVAASDYFSGGVDDLLEAPFEQVPHQKIRLDEQHWKSLPVEDVPLEGLKRTQKSIFKKHLTRNNKIENGGNDDLPWVIHHGGEHWVIDGHHRAVNAMQRGDSTFKAHVMQSPFDDHEKVSLRTALLRVAEDYRMEHRPPDGTDETAMPLHDLTRNMPDDIYTHPHYYSDMSEPSNQDAHAVIRRVRNKPDAKVRIYRALPAEHAHKGIQPGDWVTTSKEYARQHGRHSTDPKHDWPVISASVPAKHLHTHGDDLREYGYNGDTAPATSLAYKGGYHQEVSQKADGTISRVQRRAEGPLKGYQVVREPTSYEDSMAGRGQVTARGPQGDYAGHLRWTEDGITSEHVEPGHEQVGDHLRKKMRSYLKSEPFLKFDPKTAAWTPPPTTLPNGDKVENHGDAGPGGQWNGRLIARYPDTGEVTGDLQVASLDGHHQVQWMETPEHLRGRGTMTHLVDHYKRHEMEPGDHFDYGYTTDDGTAWVGKHGSVEKIAAPAKVTHGDYEATAIHFGDAGEAWAYHTPTGKRVADMRWGDVHAAPGCADGEKYCSDRSHFAPNVIQAMGVHPEHRRQGVATAMLAAAHAAGAAPAHSTARSDAGDAWARSVGGDLPERTSSPASAFFDPGTMKHHASAEGGLPEGWTKEPGKEGSAIKNVYRHADTGTTVYFPKNEQHHPGVHLPEEDEDAYIPHVHNAVQKTGEHGVTFMVDTGHDKYFRATKDEPQGRAGGYVSGDDPDTVRISPHFIRSDIARGVARHVEQNKDYFTPSIAHTDYREYTAAHELGHVHDFRNRHIDQEKRPGSGVFNKTKPIEAAFYRGQRAKANLSAYAGSSTSEGYAEAFAHHHLRHDDDTSRASAVADRYADRYGWNSRKEA